MSDEKNFDINFVNNNNENLNSNQESIPTPGNNWNTQPQNPGYIPPQNNQVYNQPPQNNNPYGQPQMNQGYNQPPQNNNPYGQPQMNQGYNQPPQNNNPYGQPQMNQGYNQPLPNNNPYGQPQMNQGYNQPLPNNNPYGQPNNYPYGQTNHHQQHQTNVVVMSLDEPNVCGNRVPIFDQVTAIVLLFINIFVPGIGTMIVGCIAGGNTNCFAWFCIGFLQLFLTPIFLIGWIWAIITGVQLLQRSGQNNQVVVHSTTTTR